MNWQAWQQRLIMGVAAFAWVVVFWALIMATAMGIRGCGL